MKFPKMPIGVVVFALFALTASYLPVQGTQAHESYYHVDIATTPSSGFLRAVNMAPGDRVTSVLAVENNGNLDFNATISARQEAGTSDFYNKLLVKISDEQGMLYEGHFVDLVNFPLGTITQATHRDLTFTAELPLATGNETQGQTATVAFDFTATGHDEQIPIGDECFEPPFSNRNFTLHQKSTVPIKFHLHDASGQLEDTLRNDVRLEVTGPGVQGGVVNYVFSIANGKLKFGESHDDPHYMARFSTWDYPVLTDATYRATVYAGSQVMCQKEFVVLKQGNRSNAP